MNKRKLFLRVVSSLLLGALTVGIISFAATKLPYSAARDEITDAASVPALLIARMFYPEGVHTGRGAPKWGYAFLGSGVLFYGVVWFAVLSWIASRKRRAVL